MIVKREVYLQMLIDRMNNGAIKVITGLRRSGKSILLFNIFYDYLLSIGTNPNNIIKIDLDSEQFEDFLDYKISLVSLGWSDYLHRYSKCINLPWTP